MSSPSKLSDRFKYLRKDEFSGSNLIISCMILYSLQGGFLNGAGGSSGKYPVTEIKRYQVKHTPFPYMSAQSWKKLLRDTLALLKDEPSYYDRLNGIGTDELDPITFIEDDLFGYSHPLNVPPKQDNPFRYRVASTNRVAPLVLTNLVSLESNISTEKGFLHLENDTSLPYSTEFSSGWFFGNIALDLDRIGVFQNSADIIEISEEMLKKHETSISIVEPSKFVVNNRTERVKESVNLLFDSIMGLGFPPKASQFLVDFSPKMLVCTVSDGFAPFGNSIFTEGSSIDLQKLLDLVALRGHTFRSPVYIGYRSGVPIIEEDTLRSLHEEKIKTTTGNVEIRVTTPGQVKGEISKFLEGVL